MWLAVQDFEIFSGTDRAKKLTADLSHMEAEKTRLGRHCESAKVSWVLINPVLA